MNLGFYSYAGAAVAYAFFAVLLLFSWRESLQGKLLFISAAVSACWAVFAIQVSLHNESALLPYQSLEIIRYIAWYIFLFKLFDVSLPGSEAGVASGTGGNGKAGGLSGDLTDGQLDRRVDTTRRVNNSYRRFVRKALPVTVGLAVLFLVNELLAQIWALPGQFVLGITGNVLLALAGLALIEQLYRNTSPRFRWATKYLFLGAGGIFIYDFYLYSDALLFRNIDQSLWDARGIVHLVAVPLIAISSARNKNWSLNVFVSRDIVLNTTAIFVGGFYLLAMAGAGYYIREFGGSWGKFGQVMFITLAVVFLFVLASSSRLRAQIKVFLGKHFYKNKYDYRLEWLRLTEDLSEKENHKDHCRNAIEAMSHIVEARSGLIWLREENSAFYNVGEWQHKKFDAVLAKEDPLIKFLSATGFVINLRELETHADEYQDLILPGCIREVEQGWLIVPLHGPTELLGFVVLANPLMVRSINWEDRDLLKTAAKQVASYLMVLMTSAQLAESKQFEMFSRLSAYMVHDLKNIAAELNLVAINAEKHAANPAFVSDAFETVENAAGDINRLLEQLRNKRVHGEKKALVDLDEIIQDVVELKQQKSPSPEYINRKDGCMVSLEKNRLSNVLAHLIDNAQQASEQDGSVRLSLLMTEDVYAIEIKDEGHGMDEDFIRDRLFKAFDTTKGNAGMGIGMHESREFIRQVGGDIIVQSKPEKGSIITLCIPAASSDSKPDSASESIAEA
ncbi:MAG: PEP-CTERM system histidine kinase PrsK [Proteobacteria bacterium]|nr:PEP-CTERM system histidine kinase PrsK [Pseudomonadota bacterium]